MEEAASVLSVYVTAYYSLTHLARLRKGQRVLIHSAMGGVGQAAIALAKHAGAEIYATAGSESKREQLLALGVRAAFDSHSYDWYDELMAATGGEGVDVVLNSLAGRHITLCLEALRPGGWHCEIGKVDIYSDNALSLSVFRKNLRFAAIDIDRMMSDDPMLAHELSQECMNLLEQGAVLPLPITSFPYRDYAQALRLMTTGQHTGKLVLQAPEKPSDHSLPIVDLRPFLDPDATYLVTGGMGGFGKLLLPYLASAGARHLTLLDRDPQRRRSVDWVRKTSALWYLTEEEEIEIDIVPGDVAEEADVRRCIAELQRPLKGVFHLAGTLDDCLLTDLTNESLAKVFAPQGARRSQSPSGDGRLPPRPLRDVLLHRLDIGQPGTGQLQRRQRVFGWPSGLPPPPGTARTVLQLGRGRRSWHGLAQSARVAHNAVVGHAADQC